MPHYADMADHADRIGRCEAPRSAHPRAGCGGRRRVA
jgi:hypothetical protein